MEISACMVMQEMMISHYCLFYIVVVLNSISSECMYYDTSSILTPCTFSSHFDTKKL